MTSPPNIQPEFPSPEAISAYGALSFLYMHSSRHAEWSLRDIRRIVQPPVDLKQTRIFFITTVCPARLVLGRTLMTRPSVSFWPGASLKPAQWRSGPQLWLMEIIAPYEQGTGANAFRAFMEHIPDGIQSFHYLRVSAAGKVRRVVKSTRLRDGSWGAKIIRTEAERN
ncbi:toxin-activating lysine-acyltransferase [Paracoccus cavernae]|uniref:toxin-activating lysine-acyltransferase n=1 Tax=Paracoccus cavernae TaxID=1571207 RepID=UPI003615ABBB